MAETGTYQSGRQRRACGYVFANAEGRGTVESTFGWNPECSIFTDGVYENQYEFTFRVVDDRCHNQKGDTVVVNININDVDGEGEEFIPPNVVTPNGDNKNDFFAMVKENENGELVNILPSDNCTGVFERIVIVNRWGKSVFESPSRDFRWYCQTKSPACTFTISNIQIRSTKELSPSPSTLPIPVGKNRI